MELGYEEITEPLSFFQCLGGLHDAYIEHIDWRFGEREVFLKISDLNVNTRGLAEYPGCESATLLFKGAYKIGFASEFDYEEDRAWIYDIVFESLKGQMKFSIINSVGDTLEILCNSLMIKKHVGESPRLS